MKKSGLVMLLSGTGGVGKSTLIKGLLTLDKTKFVSSYTTRKRRDSDSADQYQYISKEEFEDKIKNGEIFEYDIFNNEYYGTSKSLFVDGLKEKPVLLKDISVLGYANCKELIGNDVNLVSVFVTEKKSVLKQRLIDRGESSERIKNRLGLYKKEQANMINYNFIIRNTNYHETINKLETIIEVGLQNKIILPNKDYTKISAKKVDRYAYKLEKNKNLKPIKIAIADNEIYIVDGVHRYLASLKTGKNIAKIFVEESAQNAKFDLEEWKKIVKSYTC